MMIVPSHQLSLIIISIYAGLLKFFLGEQWGRCEGDWANLMDLLLVLQLQIVLLPCTWQIACLDCFVITAQSLTCLTCINRYVDVFILIALWSQLRSTQICCWRWEALHAMKVGLKALYWMASGAVQKMGIWVSGSWWTRFCLVCCFHISVHLSSSLLIIVPYLMR